MQIATKVLFHPQQCPTCQNYVMAGNRCRVFKIDTPHRPLMALLEGKTDDPCEYYQKVDTSTSPIQPPEIESRTKICRSCSSQIPVTEKICPKCGAWFSVIVKGYCPSCKTTVQACANLWCCRCGGLLIETHVESKVIEKPVSPTINRNNLTIIQFLKEVTTIEQFQAV